jgi:hypothetical protein
MRLETKLVWHGRHGTGGPPVVTEHTGPGMSETMAADMTAPQLRTRRSGDPPAAGKL